MRQTSWDAIIGTVFCAFLMAITFGWQRATLRNHKTSVQTESWEHIREQYPVPAGFAQAAEVPEAVFQAIVRANPFSPARRAPPPGPTTSSGGSSQPPQATSPQFVYKGRVLMGTTQRAVLEDVRNKKTYFAQLGQEVAGFKVLDIAENRVVLSDLQTRKELVIPLSTLRVPSGSSPEPFD
jgi:hypothetical protein